jgi:hypothetical protein
MCRSLVVARMLGLKKHDTVVPRYYDRQREISTY